MVGQSVLTAFVHDERGAASIDWIVISAACVGLGLAATNVVVTELVGLSNETRSEFRVDLTANPFEVNDDHIEAICMYEECNGADTGEETDDVAQDSVGMGQLSDDSSPTANDTN